MRRTKVAATVVGCLSPELKRRVRLFHYADELLYDFLPVLSSTLGASSKYGNDPLLLVDDDDDLATSSVSYGQVRKRTVWRTLQCCVRACNLVPSTPLKFASQTPDSQVAAASDRCTHPLPREHVPC